MTNLNSLIVTTSGTTDIEATVTAVRNALEADVESSQAAIDAIAPTIAAVFDANPGKRLSQDYIIVQACVGVPANQMKATAVAAKACLSQELASGALDSKKGRSGGTCRNADVVVATPTES